MSYIQSKDNTRLFYVIDHAPEPKAAALVVHGFGDHCKRYDDFTEYLNQQNISVLRYDYRGHGRSEGRRGHILSFDEYLEDLQVMLDLFNEEFSLEKKLLFAHSNGGLICTHALACLPELKTWTAAILSSPFYAIKVKVPKWKSFLGARLSKFIPSLQLPTDLDPTHMSHDSKVIDNYATDPLIGRVASARWLTETLQAHHQVATCLRSINIPILMQLAGNDLVADTEHAKRQFKELASSEKSLAVYDGLYHEIWFEEEELNRKVFADLSQFLHNHLEK